MFISTATLWNSPRTNLDKMQAELNKANKELVTGREVDVGLKLGYRTGEAISLRQERSGIESITDSNAIVKLRVDSSITTLAQIRETANEFMNSLIATPIADRNMAVVKYSAEANLSNLVAGLNNSTNGQYIFGGINTKAKPAADYTLGSPAKTAVANAFTAAPPAGFGFSQNDPAAAGITPDKMTEFLDGAFNALFNDVNWTANWSSASSQNIQSQISPSDRIETSVNANEKAFRDVAMAYTMALDLGISNLSVETREVVVSKIVETLSGATTGLSDLETRLGITKDKLEEANERMDLQKNIFEEELSGLEGVDPAEAKIKVDQLMTQIQTSFSLTAQLRQLNLINFL
jgi:flagellar hook-associated protein 3 FlgL